MRKKNPAAGAPISLRLADDLKADLDTAASKLKMDTHQVMRLAMQVGLEHFTRIDHNLAKSVLDASIATASQTTRHQKISDESQLALVAEPLAPTAPLPPRKDVSYESGKKMPKKTGT